MTTKTIFRSTVLAFSVAVISGCASGPEYTCEIPEDCAPVHENYELAKGDESPDGWLSDGAEGRGRPAVVGETGKESSSKSRAAQASEDEERGFFESWFEEEEEDVTRPVVHAELDVNTSKGPVFVPPKPHRIWLAHWQGETGELNSGNYTYLTTPGYYLYMGERYKALPYGSVGEASASKGGMPRATFSPIRPDEYGFDVRKREKREGLSDNITQPEVSN